MAKKKVLYTGMYERKVVVTDPVSSKEVAKVVYDVQFQYKGIRIHKTSFKNYKEAFDFYVSSRRDIDNGTFSLRQSSSETYRVCDIWEKRLNDSIPWLRESSVITYRNQVKMIEKYPIWSSDIRELRSNDLQAFFNQIGKVYTVYQCRTCRKLLSQAFIYAVENDIIARSPDRKIRITGTDMNTCIAKSRAKKQILSSDEFKIAVEWIENSKVKNRDSYLFILYTGYYTGMRIGEILALTPHDFDLVNHTVSISKQVTRDSKGASVKEMLKTSSSYAVLPIPKVYEDFVVKFIRSHKKRIYLCCKQDLSIFEPRSVAGDFSNQIKRAGIDQFHIHMLRHSYVSNLVATGTDVKTVQALARHNSITTTLQIYTHETMEKEISAVQSAFDNME